MDKWNMTECVKIHGDIFIKAEDVIPLMNTVAEAAKDFSIEDSVKAVKQSKKETEITPEIEKLYLTIAKKESKTMCYLFKQGIERAIKLINNNGVPND